MEEVDDELDDSVQQGCMLKAQDIEPLLKCGYLKAAVTLTDWERIKYWVVVTHNCDLVKSPVKDALVELFPCHEDKGEEPFSHNGSNPRACKITYAEKDYIIQACEKHLINKQYLIERKIRAESVLSERMLNFLKIWMSTRYNRYDIPKTINQVLHGSFNDKKLGFFKESQSAAHQGIFGVWIAFDPEGELESIDDFYNLQIYIVFEDEVENGYDNAQRFAEALLTSIEKYSKKKQVRVACSSYIVSDQEFTLYQINHLTKWNYDYLCVEGEP